MSLIGALNIGKSALAVQQAALQVTSNNIANAGNADYTRQTASITPNADQQIRPGLFVGTGVNLTSIQRQIDDALQGRLRGATSDSAAADANQQWLGRIESVFNELTDNDLSTQLSKFFTSWSDLANKPQDIGLRQVVVQNGQSVADWIKNVRGDLGSLQKDADDRMTALASDANGLAQQIADINGQIVTAEGGSGGQANGLRDQRDALLKQLSGLIDIKTVDPGNGMLNVMVGSEPLVVGTDNRGVGIKTTTVDGKLITSVIFKADNGTMKLTSGQLGALADLRANQIDKVVDQVDAIASNLIFELNKLHSAGQGLDGVNQLMATNAVNDTTVPLNDPKTGLDQVASNGSFVIHVKDKSTGLTTSTLIHVDLDGQGGNDTTLQSLTAELNGVAGVAASISAGKLKLQAAGSTTELSFSQDSSGVLAALGVNSFFAGQDARDIGINAAIQQNPALLAAAKNGEKGDNQTALAIAGLESQAMTGLRGSTLKDTYQQMVNGVAVAASSAKTNAEASAAVKSTFESQREALSGVSEDEEAINMMRQQRAFQGAARLIAAVDEMMKTLIEMV